MQPTVIPEKVFFKIGEVSRIIGVPEHTLRYWEDEFGQIKPEKTRSGQRLYRRRDIELLLQIKQLLWEEKFKIAGARERLKQAEQAERKKEKQESPGAELKEERRREAEAIRETTCQIRHEVQMLLALVGKTDSRGVAQSG